MLLSIMGGTVRHRCDVWLFWRFCGSDFVIVSGVADKGRRSEVGHGDQCFGAASSRRARWVSSRRGVLVASERASDSPCSPAARIKQTGCA